ncbi:MAG: bifunctional methylenetetrahydrofolate dehydrogenase/methenyltetrahydrofolate cyclohydrolase FolD [Clostridia bacterium]|nr:bifunctional methylenetetrahydrofolate dehydrogenase/methenyltetrahydrofolate cyclohydrolase FolD [Clostridia bacterium]
MKIIDGKALAAKMRAQLKEKIDASELKPGLAVVLVGEDPASQIYVRNKIKACEEIGVKSYAYRLPADTSQKQLEDLLEELAASKDIHGILLQLPLPKGLQAEPAMAKIPYEKDVDGFSKENLGKLVLKEDGLVSCTPYGVMKMLESEGISPKGKRAVVLGRSDTVGKPMALLLLNADATVTVCHSKTQNLKEICQEADILVAAIGRAKFVTEDMVKEGAVVVDVGINRDENGKLCGDVDYENVAKKASYITPVPGGVGPMTITMLMYNTCLAAFESI